VLLGDVQERSAKWDVDMSRPMIGYKPAGTPHSNRWGLNGALIFSISFDTGWNGDRQQQSGWWNPPELQTLQALMKAYLREGDGPERAQYLWDFAALTRDLDPAPAPRCAAWLDKVRDQLREDPEGTQISTLAAEIGVHRVSLGRLFIQSYGIPPSLYRRRCKAMKAVADAVATDRPLSLASQAGGFFDQSHASRTIKYETGLSMSDLRLFSELH
jgi:AraC family transcriptional regulator